MNKTDKLIVNFDKKSAFTGLITMPIMALILTAGLFIFTQENIVSFLGFSSLSYWTYFIIKVFLYFGIVICLFCILYFSFLLRFKVPAAILNQKGIWIKNYNFIPWENVCEFDTFTFLGDSSSGIGIRVKDIEALSEKADFKGKISIFWSKILGHPHIILSNFEIEKEDIIIFAHRYL